MRHKRYMLRLQCIPRYAFESRSMQETLLPMYSLLNLNEEMPLYFALTEMTSYLKLIILIEFCVYPGHPLKTLLSCKETDVHETSEE